MSTTDSIWAGSDNRSTSPSRQQPGNGSHWRSDRDHPAPNSGSYTDRRPKPSSDKVGLSPNAEPWVPSWATTSDNSLRSGGATAVKETSDSAPPADLFSVNEEGPLERPTWTTHVPWETDDPSNTAQKPGTRETKFASPVSSPTAPIQSHVTKSANYQQKVSLPASEKSDPASVESTHADEVEPVSPAAEKSQLLSSSSLETGSGAESIKPAQKAPEQSPERSTTSSLHSRWATTEGVSHAEQSPTHTSSEEAEKQAEKKPEKSAVLSGPSSLSSRWATADDTYRAERGLPATRYNVRMKAREADSYLHSDQGDDGEVVVQKARETRDGSRWRSSPNYNDWRGTNPASTSHSFSSYRSSPSTAPSANVWPKNRDRYQNPDTSSSWRSESPPTTHARPWDAGKRQDTSGSSSWRSESTRSAHVRPWDIGKRQDTSGSSSWRSESTRSAHVRPWDIGKQQDTSGSSSWRANTDNAMASSQWRALRFQDHDRYQKADKGSSLQQQLPSSESSMEPTTSPQPSVHDTPRQYEVEPEKDDWPSLPVSEKEPAFIQEKNG